MCAQHDLSFVCLKTIGRGQKALARQWRSAPGFASEPVEAGGE